MTRHGGVAFLPGQRRVRKMAHRHLQGVFVIAFGHDNGETDARDLETSDRGRRLNGPLDAMRCANGLGMDERVIQRLRRHTVFDLVEERRERGRSDA
jgi:hypothetical protein